VPEAKLTREQAQSAMDAAGVRLDNSRIAVKLAQENCRTTRAVLARSITAWQEGGSPMSNAERQEREKRNHLASEQAARARRGEPSSKAAHFVQRQMRNGPNRGAFSPQQAARLGFKMPKG
jgi:hypothetical protein